MIAGKDLLPKWTKKVVTDMRGRDPLGLSRASFIITDFLLTGIITQTDRARYYSFYCWALWHTLEEDRPNKYQNFVDGFRRREAAFAVATLLNNRDASPVGVTAANDRIEKYTDSGTIDCNFRVLPANTLGGYGQYYSGSIYQLGLTERLEDGIDRIAGSVSKQLADEFHQTIKMTPYVKKKLFRNSELPLDELKKAGERFSVDAITEPFAKKERAALIDLFLGINKESLDERTLFRRHTIALVLHIISEYAKKKCSIKKDEIDWYILYPVYYYGELRITNPSTIKYNPPSKLMSCFQLWRQFCLHQLFTQALEGLMYCVLETCGSETVGLKSDDLLSRICGKNFYSVLKQIAGVACKTPIDFLKAFGFECIPDEQSSKRIQKKLSFYCNKSEVAILDKEVDSIPSQAAKYISLIAVLYLKWRGNTNDPGLVYLSNHVGHEIWIGTVFSEVDGWFDSSTKWKDTLSRIINLYILDQHDKVMYGKRRLDSCWLHRYENRVFKDQDYGPRYRSSRHRNVISILSDLNLLSVNKDKEVLITTEGQLLLKKLLGNM